MTHGITIGMPPQEITKTPCKKLKATKLKRLTEFYAPMDQVDGDHLGLIKADEALNQTRSITQEEFNEFSVSMLKDLFWNLFGWELTSVHVPTIKPLKL